MLIYQTNPVRTFPFVPRNLGAETQPSFQGLSLASRGEKKRDPGNEVGENALLMYDSY